MRLRLQTRARLRPPTSFAILIASLLTSATAPAQRGKAKDAAADASRTDDPYTKGDEALMRQCGYVSFGPFPWGDDHGTADIRKMMPTEPLVFVETAHFKIGSSLPSWQLPKHSKRKRAFLAELKELKKRLPRVDARKTVLDPWLRVHLFAARLEDLYARVSKQLGVADADFPPQAQPLGAPFKGKQMGEGPYLGNRGKFTVLLLRKTSDLGRYTLKASRQQQPDNQSHSLFFQNQGSGFVGISTEQQESHLADDHALHCHTLYCVTISLLRGYKGFRFELPPWVTQGLAHWHVHRVDPFEHTYCPMKDGIADKQFDPKWSKNVRGLVKNAAFPPLQELMAKQYTNQFDFIDHMTAWSRVDYMLAAEPARFAAFMSALKAPIEPHSGKVPTFEKVLAQQTRALEIAWGYAPGVLDQAWAQHVLKTYPRR